MTLSSTRGRQDTRVSNECTRWIPLVLLSLDAVVFDARVVHAFLFATATAVRGTVGIGTVGIEPYRQFYGCTCTIYCTYRALYYGVYI